MLDTLQEIWGAIKRNKMRTIATGFAVASGIFLMIILQGSPGQYTAKLQFLQFFCQTQASAAEYDCKVELFRRSAV